MRRTPWAVAAVLALSLGGCPGDPKEPDVTVDLEVQGSVVSANGSEPIPGAAVKLGIGGHFSLPGTLDSTMADGNGRYFLAHSLRYNPETSLGGCKPWLVASAEGYETSSYEDSGHSVDCRSGLQNVTVVLDPVADGVP